MRVVIFLSIICLFLTNCSTHRNLVTNKNDSFSLKNNEDDKWEIIVLDPQYETFLITQQPKEFYSEQNLKLTNNLHVTEWNIRYSNPLRYNPDIYSSKIDYNSSEEYGLDFEYRLFMFFKFIEWKYQIKL